MERVVEVSVFQFPHEILVFPTPQIQEQIADVLDVTAPHISGEVGPTSHFPAHHGAECGRACLPGSRGDR